MKQIALNRFIAAITNNIKSIIYFCFSESRTFCTVPMPKKLITTDCRKENDTIKCYGNIHETQEINKQKTINRVIISSIYLF